MNASRNGMLGRNDQEGESRQRRAKAMVEGRREQVERESKGSAGASPSGRQRGGNGAQGPAFTSEPNPLPR